MEPFDAFKGNEYTEKDWTIIRNLTEGKEFKIDIGHITKTDKQLVGKRYKSDKAIQVRLETEALNLMNLHHRNIVEFYGILAKSRACLCEYVFFDMQALYDLDKTVHNLRQYLGTLDKYNLIHHAHAGSNSLNTILRNVANGLSYLHSRNIVHFNVIPSNILLCNSPVDVIGYAKIAGFSNSRKFDSFTRISYTEVKQLGDVFFKAPEVIIGKGSEDIAFSRAIKCDIWALGCIAFSLMNPDMHHPYQGHMRSCSDANAYNMFVGLIRNQQSFPTTGKYEVLFDEASELKEIMRKCIIFDSEKRMDDFGLKQYLLSNVATPGKSPMGDVIRFMNKPIKSSGATTAFLSFHDITDDGAELGETNQIWQNILKILKKLIMVLPFYVQFGDRSKSSSSLFRPLCSYKAHTSQSAYIPGTGIGAHDLFTAAFVLSKPCLRKILYSKAYMCKLAVPFMMRIDKDLCIFADALNGVYLPIVRSHFRSEVNAYYHKLPIVSFMGVSFKDQVSKSEIINCVLGGGSLTQCNTFFHKGWPGGHHKRTYAEGMIEAAWYLPSGAKSDEFDKEMMFLNLRGRTGQNEQQMKLLCQFSSIIVVFIETYDLIMSHYKSPICKNIKDNESQNVVYVIKSNTTDKSKSSRIHDIFQRIYSSELPDHVYVIEIYKTGLYDFLNVHAGIWEAISNILKAKGRTLMTHSGETLEALMLDYLGQQSVSQDPMKKCAETIAFDEISSLLPNVATDDALDTRLQKTWAKFLQHQRIAESEKVDNIVSGRVPMDQVMQSIRNKQIEICKTKYLCSAFMEQCVGLYKEGDLKGLECFVDRVASYIQNWSTTKYANYNRRYLDEAHRYEVDGELSFVGEDNDEEYFFGIHRIFRDVAQMYEAVKSSKTNTLSSVLLDYECFPKVLGVLATNGLPFELMDGDADGVPLIWLKGLIAVLRKLLPKAKLLILGVLGVQSSGKSTLLNTIFGLDFPVSAGGCTRGVFARLVKIRNKVGLDYVLVLDTEGIRGDENEDNFRKDNELVTFVVGLADIVIINMKGELYSDVAHVLPIAVHAFMRLHLQYNTKQCIFVHQNVAAPDAGSKLAPRRRKLIQTLDNAVQHAARRVAQTHLKSINQILQIHCDEDIFYLGNIWSGEPPMAATNPYYHLKIKLVKKRIFERGRLTKARDWEYLFNQIEALWAGIMSNNYVFKFRNLPDLERDVRQKVVEKKVDLNTYIFQYCANEARIAIMDCKTRDELGTEAGKISKRQESHIRDILSKSSSPEIKNSGDRKKLEKEAIKSHRVQVEAMEKDKWKQIIREAAKFLPKGDDIVSLIKSAATDMQKNKIKKSDLKSQFEQVWSSLIKPVIEVPSEMKYRTKVREFLEDKYPLRGDTIDRQMQNFGSNTSPPQIEDVLKSVDLTNMGDWVEVSREKKRFYKFTKALPFNKSKPESVLKDIIKSVQSLSKRHLNPPVPFSTQIFSKVHDQITSQINSHNADQQAEFLFMKLCEIELNARVLLALQKTIMGAHKRYDNVKGYVGTLYTHKNNLYHYFKDEVERIHDMSYM